MMSLMVRGAQCDTNIKVVMYADDQLWCTTIIPTPYHFNPGRTLTMFSGEWWSRGYDGVPRIHGPGFDPQDIISCTSSPLDTFNIDLLIS